MKTIFEITINQIFAIQVAGVKYLVVADRFSGWPEVFRQNGKAMTLVRTCKNLFAQFGVPLEVSSDGGPPFNSYEWKMFLVQWDIRFSPMDVLSSLLNPAKEC